MASDRILTVFLVTSAFFLLISPSCSQKVTVSLYYESLCPYCADFIVNHLVKVFEEGLISIVNLRLVPWGNSLIKPDGTIICQHGPAECFLNTVDACAINMYPEVESHFRFIYCTERLALENKVSEWISCLAQAGLGQGPVDNCYRNGHGKALEQAYAAETAQLTPPHIFVPWLVVNNQPLQQDYKNFVRYVCNAYRGTKLPEACQVLPQRNNSLESPISVNAVCYASKANN